MTKHDNTTLERSARALIYCRTAPALQAASHDGIEAQKERCHVFAETQGYAIDRVFSETVMSGSVSDRPGIRALLDHIRSYPDKRFVVVIDDLKRIARAPDAQAAFRCDLRKLGVRLDCIATPLCESPENAFADTVLAARRDLEEALREDEEAV